MPILLVEDGEVLGQAVRDGLEQAGARRELASPLAGGHGLRASLALVEPQLDSHATQRP